MQNIFRRLSIFRSLSLTLASGLVLPHREENTDPWQMFDPWKFLNLKKCVRKPLNDKGIDRTGFKAKPWNLKVCNLCTTSKQNCHSNHYFQTNVKHFPSTMFGLIGINMGHWLYFIRYIYIFFFLQWQWVIFLCEIH